MLCNKVNKIRMMQSFRMNVFCTVNYHYKLSGIITQFSRPKSTSTSYGIRGLETQNNVDQKDSTLDSLKSKKSGYKYNYGLPGMGKNRSRRVQEMPIVTGEILFGIHPTVLAFGAERRPIHQLYVKDTLAVSEQPVIKQLLQVANRKNIDVQLCDKALLDILSHSRPHQGLCTDVGKLQYESLDSISTEEDPYNEAQLWLVLDSVQDPMNFGAILRSAYFLGVDRIFAVRDHSCSLTPVVSKASAGAMEICPVYAIPDLITFLKKYLERGWTVLGTASARADNASKLVSYLEVTLNKHTIVILGNEGHGMVQAVQKLCHHLLTISPGCMVHPMINCLNVSVAGGIILQQLCKSKNQAKMT